VKLELIQFLKCGVLVAPVQDTKMLIKELARINSREAVTSVLSFSRKGKN
jgi:hypothetical protein